MWMACGRRRKPPPGLRRMIAFYCLKLLKPDSAGDVSQSTRTLGTFSGRRHISVKIKFGSEDARSGHTESPVRTIVDVRLLRTLLVSAVIAFHLMVMVCGPSLHALPGIGHHVEFGADAGDRHEGQPVPVPHGFSDHCLVCQFFSQGQLPIATACVTTSTPVLILDPVEIPFLLPHFSPIVSHPRAPPNE